MVDHLTEAERELLAYLHRNYDVLVEPGIICLAYHNMRGDLDRLEAWLLTERMILKRGAADPGANR